MCRVVSVVGTADEDDAQLRANIAEACHSLQSCFTQELVLLDMSVYDKVVAFKDVGEDVFPHEARIDSPTLQNYERRLRDAYGECVFEMRRSLKIEKADIALDKLGR